VLAEITAFLASWSWGNSVAMGCRFPSRSWESSRCHSTRSWRP